MPRAVCPCPELIQPFQCLRSKNTDCSVWVRSPFCRYVRAMRVTKPSRFGVVALGLLISSTALAAGASQDQTSPQTSAEHQQAQSNAPMFASDAGLVLNFIKPEKAADFEAVIAKLREALQKSDKPERKQQAAGWKVFRAAEPGANGSVLFIFTMDPAVHGTDYAVSTILSEAFPSEAQALYKSYAESYASGQSYVNLKLVTALGADRPFIESVRVAHP